MIRNRIVAMLVAGVCSVFWVKSQDLPSDLNVIPPSPNVSALNKYIEVPVSQYTGVPSISVPIYNIQMQQLSLPISLNYHASGLKVEEYASWVGAGWSLSAGGTVNRSVRGLPDEFLPGLSTSTKGKKGYFFNNKLFQADGRINISWLTANDAPSNILTTPSEPVSTPDSLATGWLDTQPDLYNFSYPGGSGKFVFSRTGEIMRFTKDDTKFIEHPFDGPSMPMAGYVPSSTSYVWIIQGPDGTQYKYSKAESTKTYGGCGTSQPENPEPDFGHQSAWLLEEISLNGEWIRFEYVTEDILYSMKTSVTGNFKVSGSGPVNNNTCTNTLETKTQRLSRIHTSNGIEVKFIVNEMVDRLDLPGSHHLQRIEVRHGNTDVSFHKLHHGYFGTDKKLKLLSVNQENADESKSLPGQTFTYFDDVNFPALDSNSQDFWGLYNGASNGAFIIPSFKREEYHVNQASTVNRDPVLLNARIGTLQKITYPTGGNTTFEYELNSYYEADHVKTYIHEISATGSATETDVQTTDPFIVSHDTHVTWTDNGAAGAQLLKLVGNNYQVEPLGNIEGNRNVLVAGTYRLRASSSNTSTTSVKIEYEQTEPSTAIAGGLRVKRIVTLDSETGNTLKKSYVYTQEGSSESSGKLFAPLIHGGDVTSNTTGTLEGGNQQGCSPGATVNSISVRSVSQLPSTFYHGSHIGYSRVLEYAGDEVTTIRGDEYPNGATVSEFINEVPAHNVGAPFIPTVDLGHKNGKLLKQTVYKYVSDITNPTRLSPVSQTENIYTEEQYEGEKVFSMAFAQMNTFFCYTSPTATDYIPNYYELKPSWHYLSETIEQQFFDEGTVVSSSKFGYPEAEGAYRPYYMYDSKEWQSSQGEVFREEYLRDSNFPTRILRSERRKNNVLIGGNQVTYNGKLPVNISTLNLDEGTYRLIKRYSYAGNLLDVSENYPQGHGGGDALGQEKRYLWGYGGSLPVAEIVGYLGGVDPASKITQATLDNPATDQELIDELEKLRKDANGNVVFKGALITTYTYKRGVGITSMTDPNGLTTKYFYDAFNRLVKVLDHKGNIIQTYKYHYKGQ